MRKAPVAILVSVLVPAVLALPVTARPTPKPRPVEPKVASLPLAGIDAAAARAAGSTGDAGHLAVLTPERQTERFALLGVTWRTGVRASGRVDVKVRTRTAGRWSGWAEARIEDNHAPDNGTAEAAGARGGTDPLYVGPSDGVQVRVDTASGSTPNDLRVVLVDPGESPADATPEGMAPMSTAAAYADRPTIYTRAQWGADERIRTPGPGIGSTIEMGWVHHTVSTNSYTQSQVPGLVRSIYAYHVRGRGYSDIAYNFLVDKFGRLWEGRAGGIDQPVIGAHTENYNYNTFAVSAIGDFSQAHPTPQMLASIARLQAWKLGLHYRDPDATTTLRGRPFKVISGHRDSKSTECPGQYLYEQLGVIRSQAMAAMGAGFAGPVITGSPAAATVTASTVRGGQHWSATLRSDLTGWLPRSASGTTTAVSATLPYTDRYGLPLPTGYYDVRLDGSYAGRAARGYEKTVAVAGSPPTSGATAPDGALAVAAISRQQRLLVQTASPAGELSPTVDIHGRPKGLPNIARMANGRFAVAARGIDDGLYVQRQNSAGSWPAIWDKLPGRIGGSPAMFATGTATALEIFARGSDGQLWWWSSAQPGSWTGPRRVSGRLAPGTAVGAVRTADGVTSVAVRGTDSRMWLRRHRLGQWDARWIALGAATRGDISAVAASRNTIFVSQWAADDTAKVLAVRAGRPLTWARVGTARSGVAPTLAGGNGRPIELLIRDAGGDLLTSRWSAGTWRAWHRR